MNSNKRSTQRKIRSKSCLRFGHHSTDDCHTNEEQIEGEINGDIEYEFDLLMDNNEITEIVLSAKRETSGEHDSQHYDEEYDEECDEEDHNDNSEHNSDDNSENDKQTKHLKCKYKDCSFRTKYKNSLKRHHWFHTKDKSKICFWPDCGLRFSAADLAVHQLSHAYVCEHNNCHYKTRNKYYFQTHQTIVHSSERLFACDWSKCGKQFKFGHQLKRHKSIHSGLKPFKYDADGCGQSFSSGSTLSHHKSVHAVKRFACDQCHKKFARKTYLIDHKKRHFGYKEFKCEYRGCNKCFINKQELKLHTRHIHTKDKRYECDLDECGKMFVRGCDLKRHKKIHYRKK